MDLDDFRSVMDNAGVDVWTFIDTAILVASLDYGQELKRRRDNIVERLYATSMANKCRNCDFGGGGSVAEAPVARVNGKVHEETEEEEGEAAAEEEEAREKSVNGDDDDDFDPFAGLFDDEQKSILEIKEKLEDPDLSEEALVELLQNLEDMDITFQALQETDIGRHVNRVRKHPSNNVRRLAKQLVKKWKETVDEWVKFNQPGDLEPPSLIADEDSPQQKALHNGNRQQVPDFGYSPVPQTQNGYSGSSKNSNVTEPERKPRPVAPPLRRESPSPAKPSRPSPSQQTTQREKEHKEIDFWSRKQITGIQFSASGPAVHHLLFADDSLFICKASLQECTYIKEVLDRYSSVTGQCINPGKSAITFGNKVGFQIKAQLKQVLGIFNEGGVGNYLGLPECFSGSKVDMLAFIYERLKDRLSGWFARLLSHGGKEILLKAVALAMPVYAMSCFRFPKKTCKIITAAMADFWWNSLEHKQKIHWMSWEKMCMAKKDGGMGFRDIEAFNQALLAKQAWRILSYPDCLMAKVLKSRYFDKQEFLQASLGPRPSFVWRSILHGRTLLIKGLQFVVGNGASKRVWLDLWMYDEHDRFRAPLFKNWTFNLNLKVSDLIDDANRCWDRGKLEDLFFPGDVRCIMKSQPVVEMEDFWIWKHNRSGFYSVKSGYWLISNLKVSAGLSFMNQLPSTNSLKTQLWKLKTAPKIKIFLWRAISQILPVAQNVIDRGVKIDPRCQAYGAELETTNHVLFSCPVARLTWAIMGVPCPEDGIHEESIFVNLSHILTMGEDWRIPQSVRRSIPWVMWILWKNRNKMAIEGLVFEVEDSIKKIKADSDQWFLAQAVAVRMEDNAVAGGPISIPKWKNPPPPWMKCDVGSAWDKANKIGGVAWVLRDSRGDVMMHSRRAFSDLNSLLAVKVQAMDWAANSMKSHKVTKVIFSTDLKDFVGWVNIPRQWPAFQYQAFKFREAVNGIQEWKLESTEVAAIRGASLIAQSVVRDHRYQSYVAVGEPSWLRLIFEDERVGEP